MLPRLSSTSRSAVKTMCPGWQSDLRPPRAWVGRLRGAAEARSSRSSGTSKASSCSRAAWVSAPSNTCEGHSEQRLTSAVGPATHARVHARVHVHVACTCAALGASTAQGGHPFAQLGSLRPLWCPLSAPPPLAPFPVGLAADLCCGADGLVALRRARPAAHRTGTEREARPGQGQG
eukprot:scaffold15623_cov65-Phaeocystis_antarctica.AAC.1